MSDKYAFSIDELAALTGLSRTAIYGEIDEERLIAKKFGRRTIILREHAESFLKSLPDYLSARANRKSGRPGTKKGGRPGTKKGGRPGTKKGGRPGTKNGDINP
jgi:hypothetical protein